MPKIQRIQIKNFRSIKNLDIEVKDLAAFVGDNDSGKSNILRALNLFFNDIVEPDVQLDFERDFNKFIVTNRRARQIEVSLTFELPEKYHKNNGERAIWEKVWRLDGEYSNEWKGFRKKTINRLGNQKWTEEKFKSRSKVPKLLRNVEFEYIPAIRGGDFFRNLRGRIYRAISDVSEKSFRDSSLQFEAAIGEKMAPLMAEIAKEIKDSTLLKLPIDLSQIFETLDFLSADKLISLDQRGDGIKGRYVPLILKFIANKKKEYQSAGGTPSTFIWAYEEPENNLEMHRAQETAELFLNFAAGKTQQILLTTHSPIFYNITSSNESNATTLFVSKRSDKDGSICQTTEKFINNLDEKMGIMPTLAPYIAKAQKEVKELKQRINDLKTTNHTIYVEGKSDFIVLNALINALKPKFNVSIVVAPPPERAGANYVTNMLRAWEYKTKCLNAKKNRKQAIGFLDNDLEGNGALARFNEDIKKPKYVKLFQLPKTQMIKDADNFGLILPNCLEEQFPKTWWEHAKSQDWLESRNDDEIRLKYRGYSRDKNFKFRDLFENKDWELHATYKTHTDHKVQFAKYVANLDHNNLVSGLDALSSFLLEQVKNF